MSGGYWNYTNDYLANDIFGYNVQTDNYIGDQYEAMRKIAIRENPLGDLEVSALVFDVFCLLHSYDWAKSGDTDYSNYQKNVEEFKKRWLKKLREEQVREIIDVCTDKLKQELYETFA